MEAVERTHRKGPSTPRSSSPVLAERYGRTKSRGWGIGIIATAGILACSVATAGDLALLGLLGSTLWAALMAVALRRSRRPRDFFTWASLALIASFAALLGGDLLALVAAPAWIPWVLIYVLFAGGVMIHVIATLLLTYLWFARTGRIR